jgi:RNA polymerase sigma factor (sigma-70 family)
MSNLLAEISSVVAHDLIAQEFSFHGFSTNMNGDPHEHFPTGEAVDRPCVCVIDEYADGRREMMERFKNLNFLVREFVSPLSLFSGSDEEPACIVMVQRAAGDGYAELIRQCKRLNWTTEVVILAAKASIELAVQAMRLGAFHVYDVDAVTDGELAATVHAAAVASAANREQRHRRAEFNRSIENLSPRERDVLRLVVVGMPNKQIARQLGISIRTVEDRRRNIYHKLGVDSAVQLVTLVLANDWSGSERPLA